MLAEIDYEKQMNVLLNKMALGYRANFDRAENLIRLSETYLVNLILQKPSESVETYFKPIAEKINSFRYETASTSLCDLCQNREPLKIDCKSCLGEGFKHWCL